MRASTIRSPRPPPPSWAPATRSEVARPEQAELHQEQELGPARVRRRVFAEPGQERACLFGGLGPMKRERPEHGQGPSAAAGRTISSAIIRRYSMRAFTSRGRL